MLLAHHHAPRLGDLVGVAGADHVQARHRPQRGELLDGLVGGPVLAEADRVVAEPVDHRQLHQRREADRRAGVVGEDQVGRPHRAQLGEREPVGDRRRLVLADAVVELTRPERSSGAKVPAPSKSRPLAAEPVRSAEPLRSHGTRGAIAFSTSFDALRVAIPPGSASKLGISASQPSGSSRRCIWSICGGEARAGVRDALLPLGSQAAAPLADPVGEVLVDAVGDQELGVLGPPVGALGLAHLLLAQRLAVGLGGVLLVGRAVADVAVDDDQRGPPLLPLERLERPGQQLEVVGVADPGDVPAVAHEARGDVVAVGELGAGRRSRCGCCRRSSRGCRGAGGRRSSRPRSRPPPSGSRRRRSRRRRSRTARRRSARRATCRRSPSRRWSRCPGRAGRWSSRRPRSGGTRDGRRRGSRAGGTT